MTEQHDAELVKRLRDAARFQGNPIERAALLLVASNHIKALESRVGVLEGALEPFAAHAAEQLDHYIPPAVAADDATPIWGGSYNDRTEVTVGDFKRARAALVGDT